MADKKQSTNKTKKQPSSESQATGYNSNPFTAAGVAIGKLYSVSPFASIVLPLITILLIPIVFVLGLLSGISSPFAVFAFFVYCFFVVFFTTKLWVGQTYLYVKAYQNKSASVKQAMDEPKMQTYFESLVGAIIYVFLVAVGTVLLIVPGVIFALRFRLFSFIIVNEEVGAIESLKRSWRLTEGHTFEIWGALISESILATSGLLALSAGMSASASRYFELKSHSDKKLDTGPTNNVNYILVAVFVLLVAAMSVLSIAFRQSINNFLDDDRMNDNHNDYIDRDNGFYDYPRNDRFPNR